MTLAVPPKLARIPAGEFLMGATGAEEDERPIHRVYVAEFLISCCPVTQDEYARFVSATGHPAPGIRDLPAITAGRNIRAMFISRTRGLASETRYRS